MWCVFEVLEGGGWWLGSRGWTGGGCRRGSVCVRADGRADGVHAYSPPFLTQPTPTKNTCYSWPPFSGLSRCLPRASWSYSRQCGAASGCVLACDFVCAFVPSPLSAPSSHPSSLPPNQPACVLCVWCVGVSRATRSLGLPSAPVPWFFLASGVRRVRLPALRVHRGRDRRRL